MHLLLPAYQEYQVQLPVCRSCGFTFQFDTLHEEGTWQVAAVLRTELGADALPYYSFFDASTQEEWQQRVDAILEL